MWWCVDWPRHEFVPRVWVNAAFGGDCAEQCVQHEKRAGDGPAAAHARSGAAPVVTREPRACGCNQLRNLFDYLCLDTRFLRRKLKRVVPIDLFDLAFK